MRQLHPETIAAIQSKALFSQAEEALMAKIGSVNTGKIRGGNDTCGLNHFCGPRAVIIIVLFLSS